MKKAVYRFVALFVILSITMLDCFAYFKADGVITHDEIFHSKVQSLCDDKNSGNKLTILNSFYNISKTDKIIYIGLNADFDGAEIEADKTFKIIVSIENKPKIVLCSDGNLEYDEQYFDVEANTKIIYSSFKTEFKIIYKFPLPDNPQISLQIIDTDGLNSKIFDLDTYIPPETTSCEVDTKKEKETKPEVSKNSKKKKTSKSNKKSTNKSSANIKKEETEIIEDTHRYSSSGVVLDSNIEKENEKEQSQKIIFIAASIGLLVAIVATMIFINIKYLIAKAKEEKDKKNNKK